MKINKTLTIIFLVVAFIGFLDATYLTVQHYIGVVPPCFVTQGCDSVLTSKWGTVGSLPTSLFGGIFYLVLLLLAIASLSSQNNQPNQVKFLKSAALISPLGFLTSAYLVYVQIFLIKHLCSYCLISAGTSTILFIVGMIILSKNRTLHAPTFSQEPAQ